MHVGFNVVPMVGPENGEVISLNLLEAYLVKMKLYKDLQQGLIQDFWFLKERPASQKET